MATISITSGEISSKLTHQAAKLVRRAEPKTVEIPAESSPEPAQTPPEPTKSVSIDDLHNMVAEIQQTLDNTSPIPLRVGFRLDERADGFVEVALCPGADQAVGEASRCLHCDLELKLGR